MRHRAASSGQLVVYSAIDDPASRRALPQKPMTAHSSSLAQWIQYYSRKRIVHQWTQLHLLNTVPCQRVLEIGPAFGLVTALLVNAGYDVDTLDLMPRAFAQPDVRHI